MRIPLIKVRDKATGKTHIVGTDTHDVLELDSRGQIKYFNLQSCETTDPKSDYTFVAHDGYVGKEIMFVDIETYLKIVGGQAGIDKHSVYKKDYALACKAILTVLNNAVREQQRQEQEQAESFIDSLVLSQKDNIKKKRGLPYEQCNV